MDRQTPPSPATTKVESLPSGFNELLRHNASVFYPPEPTAAHPVQQQSRPTSRYGTPGPHLQSQSQSQLQHQRQPQPQSQPQPTHQQGAGLEVAHQRRSGDDMQGYRQQAMYPQESSPYGPVPDPPQPYGTPATSPPTPSHGSDVMGTRSHSTRGDVSARVLGPRSTRIEKSTPRRKKERAKPPKNMPTLDKPMSELTKDSLIPVADIEAYVHRSSEVRRQEVETGKNPGRVKRPMNAFMLYRKAYQQRAKEWASQHNHQIVSRVCGLSWPLEPEHIRQQYRAWADTERDNHQKAHPNYKFTPAKPQKPPSRSQGGFDGSDGSELEDYEWGVRTGSGMRSTTHTPGADSDYMPNHSVYAAAHAYPHQFAGMQAMSLLQHHSRPAALDFNMAKPMSGVYDNRGLSGQYYEPLRRNLPQRHLHDDGAENDLGQRTPSPSLAFQQPNPGLHSHYGPSQCHHKVEHHVHQQQPQQHRHVQHMEHRIDPLLMPQEEALFDTGHLSNNLNNLFDAGLAGTQQAWQTAPLAGATEAESQFTQSFMGLDETLSLEQHTQFLRGADEWQIEPLPETTHFDTNWVEPKAET